MTYDETQCIVMLMFGKNIKKLRLLKTYTRKDSRHVGVEQEISYSQEDLANELGITRGCVCHWENERRNPTFKQILDLCRLFKCTPNDLLKDDY